MFWSTCGSSRPNVGFKIGAWALQVCKFPTCNLVSIRIALWQRIVLQYERFCHLSLTNQFRLFFLPIVSFAFAFAAIELQFGPSIIFQTGLLQYCPIQNVVLSEENNISAGKLRLLWSLCMRCITRPICTKTIWSNLMMRCQKMYT